MLTKARQKLANAKYKTTLDLTRSAVAGCTGQRLLDILRERTTAKLWRMTGPVIVTPYSQLVRANVATRRRRYV
jgi:hypothetical protein